MWKITVTHDDAVKPFSEYHYSDELQAHKEFAKYVDWGFADEYATVNLYTPSLKCYTKIFYREGRKVVEK